jgi:hypothetical protein
MLRFIAVSFHLILGTVLGAVGLPLALWVALALYQPEEASRWALWALEFLLPRGSATQLASDVVRRNGLIALGIAATVLCFMALATLLSAWKALRRANLSHDGQGQIELTTRSLRVGRPVAGTIWLAGDIDAEEEIQVELSCKRTHGSGQNETVETAFWELLKVPAIESSAGYSVPFRFDVPPIAPPSGDGYQWRLAFSRSRFPYTFPSVFPLKLGAAAAGALRVFESGEIPRPIDAIVGNALNRQSSAVADDIPVEAAVRSDVFKRQPSAAGDSGRRVTAPGSRSEPAVSSPAFDRQPSAVVDDPRLEAILRNAQSRQQQPAATSVLTIDRQVAAPGTANRAFQARSTHDLSASGATDSPAVIRQRPAATASPAVSRQQPAGNNSPAASPVVARPRPIVADSLAVGRQSSVITDDGRKEPVLRTNPDLDDYTPTHFEGAYEVSGTRRVFKWLLIFLFGVPVGIATIAVATVAVLHFVR